MSEGGGETVWFLGPAVVLLAMAAPFLTRDAGSDGFWDFNRTVWLGAALAFLAALILSAGLMFASWAMRELFGWSGRWRVDWDIWLVSFGLFCPWLALSRVPRRFDAPDGAVCPRPLSMLIAYVLVPLAVGYVIIVYAYLVRILVLWELPQGQVGKIVSFYAGFGIATYLAAWPLRQVGPVHVRLFHRYFHFALLPPILLLAAALAVRVSAYGVTEFRYALVVFAIWLAAMTGTFIWRRELRLAMVPLTLAVLLAGTSFGPWGAADVSLRSQTARLASLLTDAGLFADGRVLGSSLENAIGSEDRQEVVSIVRYLDRTGRLHTLDDWFEEGAPPDAHPNDVLAAISPDADWYGDDTVGFDFQTATALPVGRYDMLLIVPVSRYSAGEEGGATLLDGASLRWSYSWPTGILSIRIGEEDKIAFNLVGLAKDMHQRFGDDWPEEVAAADMTLDDTVGAYDVRLSVQRLEGSLNDEYLTLFDADVVLLFRTTEATQSPTTPPG